MNHNGDPRATWVERGACPNCGNQRTTALICASREPGSRRSELQCSSCGVSYDGETWEKLDHPSLWDYTSPVTRRPSPYALWRDDFHTRPTLQGTYSEEINVRSD